MKDPRDTVIAVVTLTLLASLVTGVVWEPEVRTHIVAAPCAAAVIGSLLATAYDMPVLRTFVIAVTAVQVFVHVLVLVLG